MWNEYKSKEDDNKVFSTPASACNCVGPQDGEPFCPCMMSDQKIFLRGNQWIRPEEIVGDVEQLINKKVK